MTFEPVDDAAWAPGLPLDQYTFTRLVDSAEHTNRKTQQLASVYYPTEVLTRTVADPSFDPVENDSGASLNVTMRFSVGEFFDGSGTWQTFLPALVVPKRADLDLVTLRFCYSSAGAAYIRVTSEGTGQAVLADLPSTSGASGAINISNIPVRPGVSMDSLRIELRGQVLAQINSTNFPSTSPLQNTGATAGWYEPGSGALPANTKAWNMQTAGDYMWFNYFDTDGSGNNTVDFDQELADNGVLFTPVDSSGAVIGGITPRLIIGARYNRLILVNYRSHFKSMYNALLQNQGRWQLRAGARVRVFGIAVAG